MKCNCSYLSGVDQLCDHPNWAAETAGRCTCGANVYNCDDTAPLPDLEPPSYMKLFTIKKALHQMFHLISVLAQSYMVHSDYNESQ